SSSFCNARYRALRLDSSRRRTRCCRDSMIRVVASMPTSAISRRVSISSSSSSSISFSPRNRLAMPSPRLALVLDSPARMRAKKPFGSAAGCSAGSAGVCASPENSSAAAWRALRSWLPVGAGLSAGFCSDLKLVIDFLLAEEQVGHALAEVGAGLGQPGAHAREEALWLGGRLLRRLGGCLRQPREQLGGGLARTPVMAAGGGRLIGGLLFRSEARHRFPSRRGTGWPCPRRGWRWSWTARRACARRSPLARRPAAPPARRVSAPAPRTARRRPGAHSGHGCRWRPAYRRASLRSLPQPVRGAGQAPRQGHHHPCDASSRTGPCDRSCRRHCARDPAVDVLACLWNQTLTVTI